MQVITNSEQLLPANNWQQHNNDFKSLSQDGKFDVQNGFDEINEHMTIYKGIKYLVFGTSDILATLKHHYTLYNITTHLKIHVHR